MGLAEAPHAVVQGAVGFLHTVLCEWFDALQELETDLGYDLRSRLSQSNTPTAPVREKVHGPSRKLGDDVVSTPLDVRFAKKPQATTQPFFWHRHGGRGGWWIEGDSKNCSANAQPRTALTSAETLKLSVVC